MMRRAMKVRRVKAMDDTKLKPCPFCGGEAEIIRYCDGPIVYYYASCKECYSTSGCVVTKEDAVYVWNRRMEDKPNDTD